MKGYKLIRFFFRINTTLAFITGSLNSIFHSITDKSY